MELMQLRYYTAVVQAGTISGGAKRLHMTQPPVSMQIRLLEEELGCRLFERGSRNIRLTEEGRVLYEQAVRILNMADSASASVADLHNAETGTLRVGVISSLADLSAERWFKGFAALHPLIDYEITEGTSYEILEALRNRILDVALVRTPFSARGLELTSLEPQDMLLIGTRECLGPLPAFVTLRQAAAMPLILYRRWKDILDSAFAAKGCRPRIICMADDARTCVAWAAAGLGAAIAPADILNGSPWSAVQAQAAAEQLQGRGAAAQAQGTMLQSCPIRGIAAANEVTLAMNEGGCDTAVGRKFAEYFRDHAAKQAR
jgi:DNA-binding transcriptional LysR family regulator